MIWKVATLFFGFFLVSIAQNAVLLLYQVPNPQDIPVGTWTDYLFGPFGALVMAVAGLYFSGRFIIRLINKNDKLHEDFMSELKKQNEELREQLKGKG